MQTFGTVNTVPHRAFDDGRKTIKWLVGPGSPDPAETHPELIIDGLHNIAQMTSPCFADTEKNIYRNIDTSKVYQTVAEK